MEFNIENINNQLTINNIKEICYLAGDINKKILKMYQIIKEMREYWYGNAYDEFIKSANDYAESLNEYFEVILAQVPTKLNKKMQNYMKYNLPEINLIEKIPMTNKGTAMRFMSDSINENKLEIESIFFNINSICDEILIKNQIIEWYDINELDCKEKIEESIKNIQIVIYKIIGLLSEITNNQLTKIEAIENYENIKSIDEKIIEDIVDDVRTKNKLIEEQFSELFFDIQKDFWNKK